MVAKCGHIRVVEFCKRRHISQKAHCLCNIRKARSMFSEAICKICNGLCRLGSDALDESAVDDAQLARHNDEIAGSNRWGIWTNRSSHTDTLDICQRSPFTGFALLPAMLRRHGPHPNAPPRNVLPAPTTSRGHGVYTE